MTMFWKGMLALALAGAVAAVALGLPDVRRYLEMRRM